MAQTKRQRKKWTKQNKMKHLRDMGQYQMAQCMSMWNPWKRIKEEYGTIINIWKDNEKSSQNLL